MGRWGRGRLKVCPGQKLYGEARKRTNQREVILCDSLGGHICLFLLGPKLEAELKKKTEAVSY